MLFEHWIYSTTIAIIAGMLYYRCTGRNYSWIIIGSAYVPNIDIIADSMLKKIGITVLIYGSPIRHGDFHNIAMLLLFATSSALLLQTFGVRLMDSFIFAGIGFGVQVLGSARIYSRIHWYSTQATAYFGLYLLKSLVLE
jgi:hypothetical protein